MNKYKTPESKLHGDGVAAPLISPYNNLKSIKNSFWVHKVTGIKIIFPNVHKKLSSGF